MICLTHFRLEIIGGDTSDVTRKKTSCFCAVVFVVNLINVYLVV